MDQMPLTLAQMGFASPQSSRKSARKDLRFNRNNSTTKAIPFTIGWNHDVSSTARITRQRPSNIMEEKSDEIVFTKPLPLPKTVAQIIGQFAPKDISRRSPLSSVKKRPPFQNNNASGSVWRTDNRRVSPKHFRKSIATSRLSSITKNRSQTKVKGTFGEGKNSSIKQPHLDKCSESKRSAIKGMTVEDVAATSVPRPTTSRYTLGRMNVKKTLCFTNIVQNEKKNDTRDGERSLPSLESISDEMTGVVPIQKSADCVNAQKSSRISIKSSHNMKIRMPNDDSKHSKTCSPANVLGRNLSRKHNLAANETTSSKRKTPKKLRFENLSETDESEYLDNSSVQNMRMRSNDSFAAHEEACIEQAVKFDCPVGISTPFRQYRDVNETFDESVMSNPSISKVRPRIVNVDESVRDDNSSESPKNDSAFKTLCEMMEGANLQSLNPKCLRNLEMARTELMNLINLMDQEKLRLTREIEIKKEALQHVDNAIYAISGSNATTATEVKTNTQKAFVKPDSSLRSKENLEKKLSEDSATVPPKTHKMDLRKHTLQKNLVRSDENLSPHKKSLSNKMYLNLKKNNTFLKTPTVTSKQKVLTESNETPTSALSSKLQHQLRILYD